MENENEFLRHTEIRHFDGLINATKVNFIFVCNEMYYFSNFVISSHFKNCENEIMAEQVHYYMI